VPAIALRRPAAGLSEKADILRRRYVRSSGIIEVEWHDMAEASGRRERNATDVAFHMVSTADFAHCEDCAFRALLRLDFSHLSTSTLTKEAHDLETGRRIPNIGRELRKLHPISMRYTHKRNRSKPK
jgi:hypothetical protein